MFAKILFLYPFRQVLICCPKLLNFLTGELIFCISFLGLIELSIEPDLDIASHCLSFGLIVLRPEMGRVLLVAHGCIFIYV